MNDVDMNDNLLLYEYSNQIGIFVSRRTISIQKKSEKTQSDDILRAKRMPFRLPSDTRV